MRWWRCARYATSAPVPLYHDGHCPLYQREEAWLARHPRRERVALVDIQAAEFDAGALAQGAATEMRVKRRGRR